MTSSTTLMTFLVKTPPNTRSVNLLGSWDNFRKPYPMRRDTRLGAGHWTGCYNFENIICDGRVEQASGTRHGGLKMGGTYWYYYQLDDDVDFHNQAEPSTTSCPMLPGQVVNTLNVPMHFSTGRSRHRNASVSSTSSEIRTMNPDDKYLNPRPAPKPALARLKTSELQRSAAYVESSPLTLSPESSRHTHGRNASLPSSSISLRSFRLPRKASDDDRGRSVSPTRVRATGLKAAFRQLAPSKPNGNETAISRGRGSSPRSHKERLSSEQARRMEREAVDRHDKPAASASSRSSSGSRSPTPKIEHDKQQPQIQTLALRRSIEHIDELEAAFAVPSFQNHRRQRSRSREPSPLRSTSVSHERSRGENLTRDAGHLQYKPLETLKEVLSAQGTSIWPSLDTDVAAVEPASAHRLCVAPDKCLPTSPNTPSLACPPIGDSNATSADTSRELEGAQCVQSKVTLTDDYTSSTDQSHFSRWTGTTASSFASSEWSSVFFDGKSPSLSLGTGPLSQTSSPWGMNSIAQNLDLVRRRASLTVLDASRMPSVISTSTVSSYDNTSPSSPASEASDSTHPARNEPTSLQKRYGMMLGSFDGYKLPFDAQTSEPTIKGHLPLAKIPQLHKPSSNKVENQSLQSGTTEDFSQFTNMQQLMQELSYLGDMIQR